MREAAQALLDGGIRAEAEAIDQLRHVCVGLVHVSRLHGGEDLLRWVVDDALCHEAVFQRLDKVQQILRAVVADIIDDRGIGALRRAVKHVQDALHDVINVGKVALHIAIVENGDRFAFHHLVGEAVIRHIWAAIGAIDREEAQAGCRDAIEMAVGESHQLVALLRGGVERDGLGHIVIRGERRLLLVSIDRAGGGINQMPHGIVPAGLQNVEEADDVRLDVHIRIRDGIAYTRLCGKVYDDIELLRLKELEHQRLIRHVPLEEAVGAMLAQNLQARILQVDVIIVVHAVESDNLMPQHQKPIR